jgi:histidinol-phosphate aminotransferase
MKSKPAGREGEASPVQARLAANENPLGPSPRAADAIKNYLSHIHQYPDAGVEALRETLSARLSLPPEWVLCGNGSDELMEMAVRVFLRPGEEGIFGWPSFVIYRLLTEAHGGVPVAVPLREFQLAPEAILSRITVRTRVVFLASPNNPTGRIVPEGDLLRLLAGIPDSVLVVLDEAYAQFVRDPAFPDSTELVRRFPNLLVVRSFSKFYGLAGLRIGFAYGNPEIIECLDRVRMPYNVNALAQVAALATLSDPAHQERTLQVVHKGLDFLFENLTRMRLPFERSEANFVLIDVGRDAREVVAALAGLGVAVRAMADYGLATHLRVSVGMERENVIFVESLAKVLGR